MGHAAARHRLAGRGAALDRRQARPSTWRCSTCTCPRWTGSPWPRAAPRCGRRCRWCCSARSAGARQAIPRGCSTPTSASRCTSRTSSTRSSALLGDDDTAAGRAGARPGSRARPRPGRAPPAAHPARRGQRRQPEAGASPAAADGLPRRPGEQRPRGDRVDRAPALRRGADGRADAGDGRARGVAPHHRAVAAGRTPAHRRDDRQRHGRRPRGVHGRRHGRLRDQADAASTRPPSWSGRAPSKRGSRWSRRSLPTCPSPSPAMPRACARCC